MKFKFKRNKYGRELLIDCEKIKEVKSFTKDTRPFLVNFHEILFITQGAGVFRLDNERIEFSKGTILLLPPNKWRQWEVIHKAIDGYFLIFEEDFISKFFNDHLFLYRFHFFYNNFTPSYIYQKQEELSFFLEHLEIIKKELRNLTSDSEHLLRAILYLLLIKLNRRYSQQFKIKGQFFEDNLTLRFKKLLEQEIRNHNDVSFYAQSLQVSKSHLNKTLKGSFGMSTSKLIKERLVAEAKRELLYSQFSISEIAYRLNFSEPSNFNRLFKDIVGIPPKAYRLKNSN